MVELDPPSACNCCAKHGLHSLHSAPGGGPKRSRLVSDDAAIGGIARNTMQRQQELEPQRSRNRKPGAQHPQAFVPSRWRAKAQGSDAR